MILQYPVPCPYCMKDLTVPVALAVAEKDQQVSLRILRDEYEQALLLHMYRLPAYEGER